MKKVIATCKKYYWCFILSENSVTVIPYNKSAAESAWLCMYTISVFFNFLRSQSFVKSRQLWHLINISTYTYLQFDSWSNESSWWNLAEKPANFAGCRLLHTTLHNHTIFKFNRRKILISYWDWVWDFIEHSPEGLLVVISYYNQLNCLLIKLSLGVLFQHNFRFVLIFCLNI